MAVDAAEGDVPRVYGCRDCGCDMVRSQLKAMASSHVSPDLLDLLDRRCAARPGGIPTYDLDLHRRCMDEITRLREQLAERTLQHKVQLDNAARFMLENEVLQRLRIDVGRAIQNYDDALQSVRDHPAIFGPKDNPDA